jgi:ion channel-forming bestrophin family protein
MIVRKTLDLKKIIAIAWRRVLILTAISSSACISYLHFGNTQIAIDSLPASIVGVAISILIGFRVNSAYERWWEARRIWGTVVNDSRSIARQALTFFSLHRSELKEPGELVAEKRKFVYRQIAFAYALKNHLRKQAVVSELTGFLKQDELEYVSRHKNVPNALIYLHAVQLEERLSSGFIEDFRHMQMDTKLSALTDSLGACERIKNTVFPRQYSVYTTLFIVVYTYLLPFILVSICGWFTIPLSVIIGFIFFALDTIAKGIENPFENTFNDTPMSSLCRTIEINLKEMLGEKTVPEPVEPIHGFLY